MAVEDETRIGWRPAAALREVWASGYGRADFRADALAGLVVGLVALPLSMALAVASGVTPERGLVTAIVAGLVTAALGGSRFQVSGPTAAFVVILAPIAAEQGASGLLLATTMAGVLLVGMGLLRLGRLVSFIPYPVTTGFTAGIALVISLLQVDELLGLRIEGAPQDTPGKVLALIGAIGTVDPSDAAVGALGLLILALWPRVSTRFPSPLVALAVCTVAAAWLPGADSIGSRFGDATHTAIPRGLPGIAAPWALDGGPPLSLARVEALFPSAFAIAMLCAIESLLSAVVADGMARTRHDPDAELVAQGVANVVTPFFGGFASTGAIARTATNLRSGARSPVAAMVHALFVLVAMLGLAPVLERMPLAALAALLMRVAYTMSDAPHVLHVLRRAPRSDVGVLLTCFSLTVVFDMVWAVTVGFVLAALLFMKRMADLTGARLRVAGADDGLALPDGVVVYDINGPLFFGAAEKAMAALRQVSSRPSAVVINLAAVPAMDATGLVGLESTIGGLGRARVVLAGVQPQPRQVLERAGLVGDGGLAVAPTVADALALLASPTVPRPAVRSR